MTEKKINWAEIEKQATNLLNAADGTKMKHAHDLYLPEKSQHFRYQYRLQEKMTDNIETNSPAFYTFDALEQKEEAFIELDKELDLLHRTINAICDAEDAAIIDEFIAGDQHWLIAERRGIKQASVRYRIYSIANSIKQHLFPEAEPIVGQVLTIDRSLGHTITERPSYSEDNRIKISIKKYHQTEKGKAAKARAYANYAAKQKANRKSK